MTSLQQINEHIQKITDLIKAEHEPQLGDYSFFLQEPNSSLELIPLIEEIEEETINDQRAYYSALVFALDLCISQLQTAGDNNNKAAAKSLDLLMVRLAGSINKLTHSLSFWLPVLNSFYEMQVDLNNELKNAYFELANQEDEIVTYEEEDHLEAIRELINDLSSDLSIFDITENFFAQSYAMPADFFIDLLLDLYSIEEGQDIALLLLLHPNSEVRAVVKETFNQIIERIELSPISLSRLQAIKNWHSEEEQERFNFWLKLQRKKGAIFAHEKTQIPQILIKASEVDGSGAQGIFIQIKEGRKYKLGGLLFKDGIGIKDAWITPAIPAKELVNYYNEAFHNSLSLREVDLPYLIEMTEHFLSLSMQQGEMPNLHFLEIQELLGLHFKPKPIDINYLMEQLSVQISPFTQEAIHDSLHRSKNWSSSKKFTESWYVENANIDKLVNRNSSFVDGIKVCNMEKAIEDVFANEFEKKRSKWLFHFLWTALWVKAKAKKNEKIWQDSFFIAYMIDQKTPLKDIPIMYEVCHQSVINSIETMTERRTYLNKE